MALTFTNSTDTSSRVGAAKTRYYIGTKAADGTTDAYVEIRGVNKFPKFGTGTADEVSQPEISSAGNKKDKGLIQYGGGDMTFTFYADDDGQAAVKAAAEDFAGGDYNMCVVFPDIKTPATGHGTQHFLKVIVRGADFPDVSTPNTIYTVTAALSFNDSVVTVAAA